MVIHFYDQEIMLLKKYAEEYKTKTGDVYSIHHIMSILTDKYEENLAKDLKEVMDVKVRELEEEQAGEVKNNRN